MSIPKPMLTCVVLFFACVGYAQNDTAAQADAYMRAWEKQGRFSGAVLIAKGDKVLLRKGYGLADHEHDTPNSPETVFRIGSITKMFTAFSVLQHQERGQLSVSEPASKYVPAIPKAWSGITIHQLLTHTSGIPDFVTSPAFFKVGNRTPVEAALLDFATKPLLDEPGARFRYSNSGYVLLGRIIEKVSGKTYDQYVNDNIILPAGMTHTGYEHKAPLLKPRARGYIFHGEELTNAPSPDTDGSAAAGGLNSTLGDLYRFDRALKAGKLFSPAITMKAWTPYTHWTPSPMYPYEADFGYGWMIGEQFDHAMLFHGGWVDGFVSQFARFPDDDVVVIVLSNIETGNVTNISRDLSAIVFGAPYQAPPGHVVVHPDRKVLERYLGRYAAGPFEVKITMEDGRLFAFGTGQRVPFGMIAYSDREFFFNEFHSEVRFVAEANAQATQCIVKLAGQEIPLNRVPD